MIYCVFYALADRNGDRICIFGFSRGAYTARALAGMIEKVGLLPAGNHQQVPFAYKMYMKDDDEGVTFSLVFDVDVDAYFWQGGSRVFYL